MNEYAKRLAQVYNTMLSIHTCGEDSFTMTDCMRELRNIIMKMSEQKEE